MACTVAGCPSMSPWPGPMLARTMPRAARPPLAVEYPALKHKPPFLAAWGKNDPFFLPPGAEAFKRDTPDAIVRIGGLGEPHGRGLVRGVRARPVHYRRQGVGQGRNRPLSRASGCQSLHHALPMAGLPQKRALASIRRLGEIFASESPQLSPVSDERRLSLRPIVLPLACEALRAEVREFITGELAGLISRSTYRPAPS
jgi:hypothetical protein